MKILLVDDDQELLKLFEIALKKENYEIILAYTGKSAIEKAKQEKPGFIYLDQILPDISGNDILKTLKQDSETKAIPVAMLSNFGQKELVQEALSHGAVDYVLKYQVGPEDLVKKTQELLKEVKSA